MTQSLTSVTNASKEYLQHLLDYLKMNKENPKEIEKTEIELKNLLLITELSVEQALLWLKEAEKLDMFLHQNAANISEEDWTENEKVNQQFFEMIVNFSKAVLKTCESLKEKGLTIEKYKQLKESVSEFERNIDWSVNDYADSEIFQKFIKEAKEEYQLKDFDREFG